MMRRNWCRRPYISTHQWEYLLPAPVLQAATTEAEPQLNLGSDNMQCAALQRDTRTANCRQLVKIKRMVVGAGGQWHVGNGGKIGCRGNRVCQSKQRAKCGNYTRPLITPGTDYHRGTSVGHSDTCHVENESYWYITKRPLFAAGGSLQPKGTVPRSHQVVACLLQLRRLHAHRAVCVLQRAKGGGKHACLSGRRLNEPVPPKHRREPSRRPLLHSIAADGLHASLVLIQIFQWLPLDSRAPASPTCSSFSIR